MKNYINSKKIFTNFFFNALSLTNVRYAGIRCPHHNCREIHQSLKYKLNYFYAQNNLFK